MEAFDANSKPSIDESHVGVPINVGISGIQQVIRCIQGATSEVRDLILNECELVYECRACRNLFRSLANFVYHKRQFCKKHFCESMVLFSAEDMPEEVMIVQPESPTNDNAEDGQLSQETESDDNDAVPSGLNLSVSIPKIYQPSLKLTKLAVENKIDDEHSSTTIFYTKCVKDLEMKSNLVPKRSLITLQNIATNPNAVYQSVKHLSKGKNFSDELLSPSTAETSNLGEIREKIAAAKTAIVSEEDIKDSIRKQFRENDAENPNIAKLKLRSDCDAENLLCLKCKTKFMSSNSLEFHMRTIHSDSRVYYPCPFCSTSFVQLWGVTRHIINMHKKTKDQAYKLRETIKKRGFRKNPEVRNMLISRTSSIDRDPEGLKNKRSVIPKKNFEDIISSGSQSSQNPKVLFFCRKCNRSFARKSSRSTHEKYCSETDKKSSENEKEELVVKQEMIEKANRPKRNAKKKEERDFVDTTTTTTTTTITTTGTSRNPNKNSQVGENSVILKSKLSASALEKKALAIINTKKLQCLKCNRRFSTFSNLRRHAAIHIGWNRYKCKYCEYQSYNRTDCRNHIKRNHLQGRLSTVQVDKFVVDLPPVVSSAQTKKDKKSDVTTASSSSSSSTSTKSIDSSSTTQSSNGSNNNNINNSFKKTSAVSPSSSDTSPIAQYSSPSPPKKPRKSKEQCLYAGNDTISTLVTRSGSYPKRDLVGRCLQSKSSNAKQAAGNKKIDAMSNSVPVVLRKKTPLSSKFQKFIYVHEDYSSKTKEQSTSKPVKIESESSSADDSSE